MQKVLYVLGVGSTAFEIRKTAVLTHKWDAVYCIAPQGETNIPAGALPYDQFAQASSGDFIFGMTSPEIRNKWTLLKDHIAHSDDSSVLRKSPNFKPASVIHPQATIFDTAKVGLGTYIAAGAIISHQATLGHHCVINFNCVIGHDSQIGDHTSINPGATIGGYANIGTRTLIGANSFIYQGKSVGDDCKIDALTYVDRDIPNAHIATSRGELKILPNLSK